MTGPKFKKSIMARRFAELIRDAVHGEEGFIAFAREIKNHHAAKPLPDESVDAIGGILWSDTRSGDMARKARLCGYISALFDLARWYKIKLPKGAADLEPWCDTIFPL